MVRILLACAALCTACDPPAGPADPWAPAAVRLRASVEAAPYDAWTLRVLEAESPHGPWSAIYTDARIDAAEAAPVVDPAREQWPAGATIVAEGRDAEDGDVVSLQIMRRDRSGWLWAQYDADGEPTLYGTDTACSHCHAAGDDYVRSLDLPR